MSKSAGWTAEKTESERPDYVEVDGSGLKLTVQNAITWNAPKMDSSIGMKGNGLNLLTVQTMIQSKIRIRVRSELMD